MRRGVVVAMLALAAALPAGAADVPCGVGGRVLLEGGSASALEIVEVGTEPPHVGWYRLVGPWNAPAGDWYDPRTWAMHPEGRAADRCVVAPPAPPMTAATPLPAPPPAPAAAPAPGSASPPATYTSTDRCRAGRAVQDRQGARGTILGERNGMCVVQQAGGARSYLHWMLAEAGGAPAVTALTPGAYVCSAQGAGSFRLTIDDATRYTSSGGLAGRYRVEPGSGELAFESGSLAGYHGKALGATKFGLSSKPTTMYYTVCNRD